MAVSGADSARTCNPCHLGRNPRRGGSLARERSMVARAVLVGEESVVSEVIFWEERFKERNDIMIIVVVIM